MHEIIRNQWNNKNTVLFSIIEYQQWNEFKQNRFIKENFCDISS